ncbi:RNA polymerase factor sigma-54 [Aquifex aeolicus]|uniref:RNA polymerase sigma factor RpoN n=4 Tax=Aquifex aeolicus TaxID=63363 RepID=O66858_AQUAE|nr:RNA polymerase factor sigma-54 [Aquifex aeolicus]AAC06814.1 RNA polymerase sigma factor RpoN [Aquifex aeolicus VF5]
MLNQRLEVRQKLNLKLLLKQDLELLTYQTQELEKLIHEEVLVNPLIKGVFKKIPKSFEVKETVPYQIPYTPSELEELQQNIKLELEGKEQELALELLNYLNEKGFLSKSVEEISDVLRCSVEELEKVRQKVLRLEPLGVCSKDVWEFLELQIEEIYPEEEEILKKALRDLKRGKKLKPEIKGKLSRLRLFPLSSSAEKVYTFAKVDAIIEEENGEFFIYLYEDFIDIDLNEEYWELYKKSRNLQKELKEAFERYESIRKVLDIRRRNLRKVLEKIVERQKDFLTGKGSLKPLTLREVSSEIGIHESTLSRIVNSKYVKTPVGTYSLRTFFVRESAEGLTQGELMKLIKEIVENEDKRKPYSDQEIANILKEKGFKVARRTVAKYREMLGIPSSRERRI